MRQIDNMATDLDKKRKLEQGKSDNKTPVKRLKQTDNTSNGTGSPKTSSHGLMNSSSKSPRDRKSSDFATTATEKAVADLSRKERRALKKLANGQNLNGAVQAPSRSDNLKRPAAVGNSLATEEQLTRYSVESDLSGLVPSNISSTDAWSFSPPIAGRYLPHDPVFVQDAHGRDCLLAATDGEIQLLSLDTSLVVRSYVAPPGNRIICFAVLDQTVDIAFDDGTITAWNYITTVETRGHKVSDPIEAIAVSSDGAQALIRHSPKGSAIVIDGKTSFKTASSLTGLEIHKSAVYVVAWGPSSLVLGMRKGALTSNIEPSNFAWVEIPVQVPITCATSRLVPVSGSGKKQDSARPDLAVAIGNREGQIQLYTRISTVFSTATKQDLPSPRILHWHRNAVSAVTFSADGNYLISGGKETVLVLWQLATGKRQYLPHLTAEIQNIVVNAKGTRYALRMGDNSILVLSTSELKAVAHFPGLQLPAQGHSRLKKEQHFLSRTVAALHPRGPHLLLLAVPSSIPGSTTDNAHRPFLQTFDIRNSRHISRQALTRNNVTDFNVGPEGEPIKSPDVTAIALSADGKWLASVDEWLPPLADLKHVMATTNVQNLNGEELEAVKQEHARRREIHLKFWQWDETEGLWALNTRADSPHAQFNGVGPGSGAGRILRLVADPSSGGFVTIGEDSQVKIWRPKAQTRHGVVVKDDQGNPAMDWACRTTVQLPVLTEAEDRADSPMTGQLANEQKLSLRDACLTFSADGSLLACAQVHVGNGTEPMVHFVSLESGSIVHSKSRLTLPDGDLTDFAFIDRYFVAVSTSSIRVWDLVENAYHWTIALSGPETNSDQPPLMAVDRTDNTFLVVDTEGITTADGIRTTVCNARIFNPKMSERLFETSLPVAPVAVLSTANARGYTLVFEDGSIQTLTSTASPATRQLLAIAAATRDDATDAMDLDEADAESVAAEVENDIASENFKLSDLIGTDAAFAMDIDGEDDRPVVRPEQLAEVFAVGGAGSALPPVRDMFRSVVALYAKKPREAAQVPAV